MADLRRVHVAQGGVGYPGTFSSIIEALEALTALEFINMLHLVRIIASLNARSPFILPASPLNHREPSPGLFCP